VVVQEEELLLAGGDACAASERRCVCEAGRGRRRVEAGARWQLGRSGAVLQQTSAHRVRGRAVGCGEGRRCSTASLLRAAKLRRVRPAW